MLGPKYFADSARFRRGESGAIKLRAARKHVGSVVVAEQENVVGFFDPVPEPERCLSRVAHVIAEIIEIIAEEHHPVITLRRQPMIGVVGMMVKVGNDQRAHWLRRLEESQRMS